MSKRGNVHTGIKQNSSSPGSSESYEELVDRIMVGMQRVSCWRESDMEKCRENGLVDLVELREHERREMQLYKAIDHVSLSEVVSTGI